MVFISFLICTLSVAVYSFAKTKLNYAKSLEGLFLAGRSNSFLFVASSLLLTNLSANQFIGENESVYINNLSVIGWGVTSVFAMLLVSEFLLPIYFRYGFTTIPDFLELRYSKSTKTLISSVILVSYIINLLPPILYGGAISLSSMFSLPNHLGITYWQSLWILVWSLGTVGCLYTIIGGLKLIAISDVALGFGLLLLSLLLPIYGFHQIGDGNILSGIQILLNTNQEKLNAVGSSADALPFSTLFTGMILVNIYYWGMEQYIVQQTLSAKNLEHAQKGMTFAAGGKLFMPILINLPGLLALYIIPQLENTASVFPLLIAEILPELLVGFTLALVFGAAMTTYTAGLQSCGTLFVLNIYKPFLEKKNIRVSEAYLVRKTKLFEIGISIMAMLIAPFIMFAHTGFYTYLQTVSGFFSMPIFTIIVVGLLSKNVPPKAAKSGVFMFMGGYFICEYILNIQLHFLHLFAILFLLVSIVLLLWGRFFAGGYKTDFQYSHSKRHHQVVPWKNRLLYTSLLLLLMVAIYIIFSPIGIAA